jgi:hypothetical protein
MADSKGSNSGMSGAQKAVVGALTGVGLAVNSFVSTPSGPQFNPGNPAGGGADQASTAQQSQASAQAAQAQASAQAARGPGYTQQPPSGNTGGKKK